MEQYEADLNKNLDKQDAMSEALEEYQELCVPNLNMIEEMIISMRNIGESFDFDTDVEIYEMIKERCNV